MVLSLVPVPVSLSPYLVIYFMPYIYSYSTAEEYREGWLTPHIEIPATVIAAVFQFTNALKFFAFRPHKDPT